jgi:hypothetical protein
MRRLIAIACAAFFFSGCALIEGKGPIADPKTGPGTPWPCGTTGVECTDSMPHDCCPQNSVCRSDDAGPFCESQYVDPQSPYAARARTRRTPAQ